MSIKLIDILDLSNTKNTLNMKTKQIIIDLQKGLQFENESADWFTLSNPKLEQRIISIRGEMFFYKTIESYSKRILQLIKRGF